MVNQKLINSVSMAFQKEQYVGAWKKKTNYVHLQIP
jgi:hypothetical protein